MCGTLLYGDPTLNTSACSNKKFGPPMDRDGNQLPNPESAETVGKQPPCFLRCALVFCAVRMRWFCSQSNKEVVPESLR